MTDPLIAVGLNMVSAFVTEAISFFSNNLKRFLQRRGVKKFWKPFSEKKMTTIFSEYDIRRINNPTRCATRFRLLRQNWGLGYLANLKRLKKFQRV
jgi:hypothetical protein